MHTMEYNSAREELRIPEYGRNIQKLIQHAVATEDKEFRQALTERIIELMMQMHPQNRNVEDYRDKLWKHLYYISEFKIDVVPPSGKIPTPEGSLKRPGEGALPRFRSKVQTLWPQRPKDGKEGHRNGRWR